MCNCARIGRKISNDYIGCKDKLNNLVNDPSVNKEEQTCCGKCILFADNVIFNYHITYTINYYLSSFNYNKHKLHRCDV